MKRPLFITAILFLIIACFVSSGWAGAVDDVNAGVAAAERSDYDKAIRLFTKAIDSGELSQENLSITYFNRGNAWRNKGDYNIIGLSLTTPRPSRLTQKRPMPTTI